MTDSVAYRLFQSTSPSAYFQRVVEGRDESELLSLFTSAFPEATWAGLRMLRELWHWKYSEVPDGALSAVTVHRATGRVVAHVGGLRFRTHVFGEQRFSVQSLDNMVSTLHRFRVTGQPVFSDLVREWWEACVVASGSAYAWGLPTQKNLRIGKRSAGYCVVERQRLLVSDVDVPWTRERPRSCVVSSDAAEEIDIPADVDGLWWRCRSELAISIVRDRAYFAWRYGRRPGRRYRVLLCRDSATNALRGLAVLVPWAASRDVFVIADWLVPLADGEAVSALFDAIQGEARAHSARSVSAWFPSAHAWARCFKAWGFRERPTRNPVVVRFVGDELDLPTFQNGHFGTLGDADWV